MKISRFHLSIGAMFIAAGLLIGSQPLSHMLSPRQVTAGSTFSEIQASNPPLAEQKRVDGKPNRIVLEEVRIDLPVINGYYDITDKAWTLTDNMAQFATLTDLPNNVSGNTFIYGHATGKVFERLLDLKKGAIASVYTDNGLEFRYEYFSSIETDPNDDSLFNYQGAPILTLQTCSGLWSQNRFLLTFRLVEVR